LCAHDCWFAGQASGGLREQGGGERSWMPFACARISPARGTRRAGIMPLEDASQRHLARLAVVTVALA
jgi:hypothetical protein